MRSIFQAIKILVRPRQPWPAYQDFSLIHLSFFLILPLLLLSVLSAGSSVVAVKAITLLSAFLSPLFNIFFSAIAFHHLAPLFKGKSVLPNSLLLSVITNIPFLILLAVSYHLQNQFIWFGLSFSFYLLWWGMGYLLHIPDHLRFQFMLLAIIILALFWIILIFFIQILIYFVL